jgi:hypothetical protein
MSSNVGTSLFEKKIQETIVGFCCVDKFKHESGVATAKQRHKTVRSNTNHTMPNNNDGKGGPYTTSRATVSFHTR